MTPKEQKEVMDRVQQAIDETQSDPSVKPNELLMDTLINLELSDDLDKVITFVREVITDINLV